MASTHSTPRRGSRLLRGGGRNNSRAGLAVSTHHGSRKKDASALLLLDIQNDFFEHGTLPVPGASDIVPVVNSLRKFNFDMTIVAMDSHPYNHCSFSSNNPVRRSTPHTHPRPPPLPALS